MKTKQLMGRKKLFTSINPDTFENVIAILDDVLPAHQENVDDIKYLFNYWKGQQPILDRAKTIRPEINNKIVENHAQEIVTFKTGYIYGSPVQIVQGNKDQNGQGVELLNSMLESEDKRAKDVELGEILAVCGIGNRLIIKKQFDDLCPFHVLNLNSETSFVVFSDDVYQQPVMGVSYRKNKDNTIYGVYTKNLYFEIKADGSQYSKINEQLHSVGYVPIVEYTYNNARQGAFEAVIPLMDAMNKTASDRLNGLEQFIQSLLWLHNCEIEDKDRDKMKQSGMIMTKDSTGNGMNANIKFLNDALDQASTQTVVDYQYQQILQIAGVPDRHSSTGGNTGQAIQLAAGWQSADMQAQTASLLYISSEKQIQRIVLSILHNLAKAPSEIKNLSVYDINTNFSRNTMDNLLVKTQGLLNILQAGIHPREAIIISGLFGDPEQVYQNSFPFMEKWKVDKQTEANNNPQSV